MDADDVNAISGEDSKIARNRKDPFCDNAHESGGQRRVYSKEIVDDDDEGDDDSRPEDSLYIYEEQYNDGNEFTNDPEINFSGDEDDCEGYDDRSQPLETVKSKRSGRAHGFPSSIVQQQQQQTEEDADIIVNSHLREIVDIKNQIRELQDQLHDKISVNHDKLRLRDEEDDEDLPYKERLKKKAHGNKFELRRRSSSSSSARPRTDAKKLGRRFEEGRLYKRRDVKMPLSVDRFDDKAMDKLEKKKRAKRNEVAEEDVAGSAFSGFPQCFQKRKMGTESGKARTEKKGKTATEDAVSEEAIDSKLQEMENIPPSVTSSLRKILQMTAHTPEEKYKVLDARDKLYKIMRDRDPSSKVGALVGTCPDMCPEKERLQREFQFQVSIFEMVNYPKNTTLDHNLAVKQYCRSSADQEEPLPHELRPVGVLAMTMSYLLHNVADHCELSDENLEEWYMFMWDRTRAIRKELTQQGACSRDTVRLVEQCARFHIHCAERLVDQDSSVYDDKINTENLTKCLQTLKYMYRDLAIEDVYCPNESEFVCYSLLLNLNNTSVFTELSDMSERLMSSEPVRFAFDVMTAWETRNYIRFFSLVNRTTYLNCCILRRYFNEMRLYATKTMIRSYCTKYRSPQIPIHRFVDNLNFDGVDDCCDFLSHCSFDFHQRNDTVVVDFNRLSFRHPENPFPTGRAYVTIEEKKRRPFSVVMAGGELPRRSYEDHVPQNSFAANGELKLDSLPCKDLVEFASAPVPTPKLKFFDGKSPEVSKASKDSASFFPDIFSKPKDADVADKQKETMPEASSPFSKSSDVPKVSSQPPPPPFAMTASVFGRGFQAAKGSGDATSGGSIFGTYKPSGIFGGEGRGIFGAAPPAEKAPPSFLFQPSKSEAAGTMAAAATTTTTTTAAYAGFKFKLPTPPPPPQVPSPPPSLKKEEEEEEGNDVKDEGEKLEEEEEEEEEEEKLRMILIEANKKMKQEAERRERERELQRKEQEERERKEREERKRLEEVAREERMKKAAEMRRLEEAARAEEAKRKSDADRKLKAEKVMSDLRRRYTLWKAREVFNKWRLKAWVAVEDRKMQEYFREMQEKYPPVCTEEHLNGNPHGLVIPNALMLESCSGGRRGAWEGAATKRARGRASVEDWTVVDVEGVVAKDLEIRAKRLCNKVDPFLWKVVFSVPDDAECASWKAVETFVEMNFVDDRNWRFAKDKRPLYFREACRSAFRYKMSIRRVRGCDLREGDQPSPESAVGSNALVFVVTDDCDLTAGRKRLRRVLLSRPQLPKIPVILFAVGESRDPEELIEALDLPSWTDSRVSEHRVVCSRGRTREELVSALVMCLNLAAKTSSPVPNLRRLRFSDFCSANWFESVWRRIETSLSDYRVVLKDPNFLIECYNSCVDELSRIFCDRDNELHTPLGSEFADFATLKSAGTNRKRLTETMEGLKLPPWPREIPKSSHQLKYRIHQYCKSVAGHDRKRMKELKWTLYRIIRRHLLWKGLDIYCDEDIDSILVAFPWPQLFQELSTFVVNETVSRLGSTPDGDLAVAFRLDKIEQFSYETSLISRFLGKRGRTRKSVALEDADSSPRLENDSVIVAYSAALERERMKRKREEVVEESLEDLFSLEEPNKRVHVSEEEEEEEEEEKGEEGASRMSVPVMKTNFQSISDRLDELKKRMEENAKVLKELEVME